MKKILTTIIILLQFTTAIYSQNRELTITLDRYKKMAVDSSLLLKSRDAAIQSNRFNLKSINTNFLPKLSAAASGSYTIGNNQSFNTTNLSKYTYQGSIKLEQTIYNGNLTKNQKSEAETKLSISELNYILEQQLINYSSQKSYWKLVTAIKQLEISERYVEIIQQLYQLVKDRFDNGYISRTDLLMVESRLNEAEVALISARKSKDLAHEEFNSLISHTDRSYSLTPNDTLGTILELPDLKPISHALQQRADYQISLLSVELAEIGIKSTRSLFNPRLTAGVEGIYGTPTPNINDIGVGYGYLYARFSATIFEFGKRRSSVNMAKSTLLEYQLINENQKQEIEDELRESEISLLKSYNELSKSQQGVKINDEALSLGTFSYTEGDTSLLDLLSMQLSWIESYTTLINSTYNYKLACAWYSYVVGEY